MAAIVFMSLVWCVLCACVGWVCWWNGWAHGRREERERWQEAFGRRDDQ